MRGHNCMGGCGTAMTYPGDRCSECSAWLRNQRPVWDDAAENCRNLALTIAREIRRNI